MYNYSIIIPHKNSPELLQRCLDSIPDRDDVQIIIVDDNSDKAKVDFTHFPGMSRRNTECIFNDAGGGAGRARNIALNKALGKWLVFADADDYFSNELDNVLDKYADDDDTDVVFFNAESVDDHGNKSMVNVHQYITNYLQRKNNSEVVLKYGCWAPWTRMLKREIPINNDIWFEEIPVGNDMMFVLKSTSLANKINIENKTVYYYYKPELGSVTYHNAKEYSDLLRLEARFKLNNFYEKVDYPYKWPIWRDYYRIRNKAKVKEILKKNDYNILNDLWITVKYYYAKIRGII